MKQILGSAMQNSSFIDSSIYPWAFGIAAIEKCAAMENGAAMILDVFEPTKVLKGFGGCAAVAYKAFKYFGGRENRSSTG